MSPSDQIQDLFDRALSSLPEQSVPSPQILHQRLSRRRVRSRFSTLGNSLTTTLFPRARYPRLYGGRLRHSIALSALVVVAAAALVTGLLTVGSKDAPVPKTATSSGALSFRLVDVTASPFRSLSPGATINLQCVSDVVCYSSGTSQNDFYRTTNGGLNWEQTAPLPPMTGEQGWSMLSFSCPTVQTCAIVDVPSGTVGGALAQFILTTDGGAHWTASSIPVPTGIPSPSASRFVCGDATHCLLSVSGSPTEVSGTSPSSPPQRVGTFLSTADAGLTWTQATSVPSAPAGAVWTINCGADGSCVAISALGSYPKSYVVGLRSDDWGLTWLAGAPAVYNDAAVMYASCGDTTHCMLVPVAYPSKVPYEIATTSNAGVTWQVSSPPVGWQNMPTAVSCANANDCWIATSTYDSHSSAGVYSQAAIEATYDGGTTWSSVALPTTSQPIGDVVALSCPPSGDGCMGIGNLQDHFLPPSGPTSPTVPLSSPLVISNLPGADQNQ
jgi:photosystem II stability/assembly factor-like uncharacterized protein